MGSMAGDLIIGLLIAVLGGVGAILASGAADAGIYVFGVCLVGFAAIFLMGLVRSEMRMAIDVGDLLVGLMMAVLGLVGLVLTSGATDNAIYIFGLSLFGFAVVFILGLIRRHYDKQEALRRGESPNV